MSTFDEVFSVLGLTYSTQLAEKIELAVRLLAVSSSTISKLNCVVRVFCSTKAVNSTITVSTITVVACISKTYLSLSTTSSSTQQTSTTSTRNFWLQWTIMES